MRISFIPPSEEEFKILFFSTPLHKGAGFDDISIYQPKSFSHHSRNRRGGGIFSFIARSVLPFVFKAAKPAAKTFLSSVVKDTITRKKTFKESVKKHGLKALKDTGLNILNGADKTRKKKKSNTKGTTYIKYFNKKKKKNEKSKKKKKKKIHKTRRYRNDIFSLLQPV